MGKRRSKYYAVDLFSGGGGLSEGMRRAGFNVLAAVEINNQAVECYQSNHNQTKVINKDIRKVSSTEIRKILGNKSLDLLAGCPPCQGFSAIRRLNKKRSKKDSRNALIIHFLRFVKKLKPLTIMMENVPALQNYYLFEYLRKSLITLGYHIDYKIVDVSTYGVPQRRRRLVLVGSQLGELSIAASTNEQNTVRDAIGRLDPVSKTKDITHMIFTKHSPEIRHLISMIPKNGGSRRSLPEDLQLKCHRKKNVGFNDIYGRLKWDDVAPTLTGGCLNPSKGRFLHPEKNRALTAREAALLQTFPLSYKFPVTLSKTSLALLIGNALPPRLSFIQSRNIRKHLEMYLG